VTFYRQVYQNIIVLIDYNNFNKQVIKLIIHVDYKQKKERS